MIRRATTDDVEAVKALRLRALSTEPSAYGTTHAEALTLGDDVWLARLHPLAYPTFLAYDADVAHGMAVGAHPVEGADPAVAFLYAMWVDVSHRGRGLGTTLVEAVCDWAVDRGVRVVRLHVTAGNDTAERLYQRCGFVRTGAIERRERDGATEWEMEWLSRRAAPGPALRRGRG
jgi:GNAT superfamily N-acetyltransferase